jgi:hypothetical protein
VRIGAVAAFDLLVRWSGSSYRDRQDANQEDLDVQLPLDLSTNSERSLFLRSGHEHFWDRAVSRRSFVRGSAAAAGLVLAAKATPFAKAAAAQTSPPQPKPIPGGLNLADLGGPNLVLHVFPPAPGNELITIFDFNGQFGAAEIQGLGTDSDGKTRAFDVDMRFMKGAYIGANGQHAQATLGFI